MSKHTAAPWEAHQHGGAIEVIADGQGVCELWRRGDPAKELANAKLIAAAPELLEALEYAEQWIAVARDACSLASEQTLEQIRAAIAKAAQ